MESRRSAHVLLLDSDVPALETLCMVLETRGHRCQCASSASTAWMLCASERFDCLFLHASSGAGAGLALAERLANERSLRPRHVVLMSGHPRAEFARSLRDGVVDSFLQKPAEPEQVLALVERCLDHV